MQFSNLKYILFVFLFAFSIADFSLNAATGSNDSIMSPINPKLSLEAQKHLIQNMNEEQLNGLVDQLFEMDSISNEIINAINLASTLLKEKNLPSIPSSDFYSSWESDQLFPENDKMKTAGDTLFTLVVQNEEHTKYHTPINGIITSDYGWRQKAMHKGIDIDLKKGAKVAAAFDGMVRVAMRNGGFGNVVVIRHYNGLETVYAHLSKILVVPGQLVTAGDLIGLGGSTGHSTGPHLHFEVRLKGIPINPKHIISFGEQTLIAEEFFIKKSKGELNAFPCNSRFYTIENGDTIYEIAKHFGTTTSSIKQMNNLYGKRIYLKVGQQICVAQN